MTDAEFNEALRRNINTVMKLAVTYVRNYSEAEDAAQEVFLKLFTENKVFDDHESEKAWLIRVTINHCLNRRRSVWFSRRTELDENICSEMQPEESGIFEEVAALPNKYRAVIHLYYYEGYSIEEISRITGIKSATVRTRLRRGREMLKGKLEKENYYYGYE